MKKNARRRGHGDGSIDQRGENRWRLRYRIDGKSHSKSICGTKGEATKELRRLLTSGDTGEHVDATKKTLRHWAAEWISMGAPGRKRRKVGARAIERYDELLRCHVFPTLGDRRLQALQSTEIDKLYVDLKRYWRRARTPTSTAFSGHASRRHSARSRSRSIQWSGLPMCPPLAKAITALRWKTRISGNWYSASAARPCSR
jgi:hypothetical protein